MTKPDPELVNVVLNAPFNKWLFIAGVVTLFAGGGAVTFLPVREEYQTIFMLAGAVMMALGLLLAIWRGIKMNGGK